MADCVSSNIENSNHRSHVRLTSKRIKAVEIQFLQRPSKRNGLKAICVGIIKDKDGNVYDSLRQTYATDSRTGSPEDIIAVAICRTKWRLHCDWGVPMSVIERYAKITGYDSRTCGTGVCAEYDFIKKEG